MQHWPDVVLWGHTVGVIFVVVNTERWKQKRKRNCNIWLLRGRGRVYGGWSEKKTRTLLPRLTVSPCLEIRSRNGEAINSTRNRIYSLQVSCFLLHRCRVFFRIFTFYLFLNGFGIRAFSDDWRYVCGCRLYACIKTRKFNGLDCREITSLPEIKKVIYMPRHFNHRRK